MRGQGHFSRHIIVTGNLFIQWPHDCSWQTQRDKVVSSRHVVCIMLLKAVAKFTLCKCPVQAPQAALDDTTLEVTLARVAVFEIDHFASKRHRELTRALHIQ